MEKVEYPPRNEQLDRPKMKGESLPTANHPFSGVFLLLVLETLRIQSPSQMMIGVYNHLLSKVFRFHYHSQKVIGSLGRGYLFGELKLIQKKTRFERGQL